MNEDVDLTPEQLEALRAVGVNDAFDEKARAGGGILGDLIARGFVTLDSRERPVLTESGRKAAIIRKQQ